MMGRAFRLLGLLEALSIVALFGVAMPMKYMFDVPGATQIPGMVHGMLFLAYIAFATILADKEQWSRKQLVHAYIAGVAPLGTLVLDRKFFSGKKL